ncbi:39S ribosomal protein L32-like protein [Dinothrombium tinctorium]|uniref:Large ribosomal subunit protein bL32m n=1 Tax=Dinothrombium tinctorium TaxID=1965070 RepID=A0A443R8K3_9ACAR|nr:39S ribosomal protein L32-like protein [Dinothrombium tinctorium]
MREPVFAWNVLLPFDERELQNDESREERSEDSKSILDSIFDGFLYGVPKGRRSLERRLKRKFGAENWGPEARKMLRPKNNLITCETCGHFHEVQYICWNCYQRVKQETEVVQKVIQDSFKLDAVEEDVVVRYKNDEKEKITNKRIVEIEKQRPAWFSSNLLSKTIGDVKPKPNVVPADKQAKFKE